MIFCTDNSTVVESENKFLNFSVWHEHLSNTGTTTMLIELRS